MDKGVCNTLIPLFLKKIGGHVGEDHAIALWDVAYYNPIGVIVLGDNVDNNNKLWMWNGSDSTT